MDEQTCRNFNKKKQMNQWTNEWMNRHAGTGTDK